MQQSASYTLPSAQNAALHQPSHQPPPPAFCMPVLPIPKSELAKRRLSTPGTSASVIQHPSAPPPQGPPPQPPHAGTAIVHGQGRPVSAYGSVQHTRVSPRQPIPDLKLSNRATSVMAPTAGPPAGPPVATGEPNERLPQAPSPVTAALISPRQLAPNPGATSAPLTLHPHRQLSQPQLPPPPLQAPPVPSTDLAPPPAVSGGISPRSRSFSAAGASSMKRPEQMMLEIENLTRQLQMAREENTSLSNELAKAKERINELTAKAEGKKQRNQEKKNKLKEERAKRKEMDKLDREEEKRRKEKEREDKKEKEEREKKEKEEKEKKEKEDKERKEREDRQAKKEAKKKAKVQTEEKEKEKKAKKKKDKDSEGKEKKKKGSKREKKPGSKEGSHQLEVGAPKAGTWASKTTDTHELPYGSADTPPPSREILMAENKRALEIIEDSRTASYTNETLAEIDDLVRQEERDIDSLLQPISGLERMVLVYEKSGELTLKRNAEEELHQKKEIANLKGYVVANLLNKRAIIQHYIDQPDAPPGSMDALGMPHELPPPPPETPRNQVLLTTSGGIIREPPRPPSAQLADTSFLSSGSAPVSEPPAPGKEDELFPHATYLIGLYPFAGTGVDEMPITEGDRIRLIEKLSDTWWKGANRGVIGLFPANYTRPEKPSDKARFATALYDREGKGTADQLSFSKGDRIRLLDSPEESDEWVKGRLEDDTVGWLPKAYIHIHE